MKEAFLYASAGPDLRPIYIQMALENGKNPSHPYDMAVSVNTQNNSPHDLPGQILRGRFFYRDIE